MLKSVSLVLALTALALSGCGRNDSSSPAPIGVHSQANLAVSDEAALVGQERHILAFGDSLLTGYGLGPGQSYPTRLEAALRARGINARIVNAGVSGDTTQDGLQRLAFALDNQPQPPDLVIISLGGNDMLRGLPPEQTRANLDAILTELDRRHIKALLLGMLAAPNMGADYRAKFDPIYPELAKEHHAALVPFFLQPLIGKPDLVQADHIHPTVEGIAELVAATSGAVADALPTKR